MYVTVYPEYIVDCNTLRLGQYICPDPNVNHIDPKTQQLIGCTKQNKAEGMYLTLFRENVIHPMQQNIDSIFFYVSVQCIAADNITCEQSKNNTFKKEMPCKWT